MTILTALLLGFAVALASPYLVRRLPVFGRWLLLLAPLGFLAFFARYLPEVVAGGVVSTSDPWLPSLDLAISWTVDGLSLTMGLLVSGVGALVVAFAAEYLRDDPAIGRFYGFLLAFMASMLGLVFAQNLLALYVFWELTTVTSYFLIGHHNEREDARAAAAQSLLVTAGGGLALLAGIVLLGEAGGSYELGELMENGAAIREHPTYVAIVALIFLGAFTKSAQFPFSFWLPGAMTAPTPASAYLHAATMVKAGIYLLARVSPLLSGTPLWHVGLTSVGGITMVIAGVTALGQRHFKRALAYTTVGALGALVFLIGIGTPRALEAMLLYLVAHAFYKGALFLVAGAVDHATHEPDPEALSGLYPSMKGVSIAAVLAAVSMGGLPPTMGFVAKELFYEATLDAPASAAWLVAAAFVASAFFFATAVVVGVRPFVGAKSKAAEGAHRPGLALTLPPLLLAVGGIGAVLGFPIVDDLLSSALGAVRGAPSPVEIHLWHGFGGPLLLSALTLVAGGALYAARDPLRKLAGIVRPSRFGTARGYELALEGLRRVAEWQTRVLQNGYLRVYLVVVLLTTVVALAVPLLTRAAPEVWGEVVAAQVHELVTAVLIVVAAVATVTTKSRLAAILSMGMVGFGVSLIYMMFGAPDLGLTQLIVETLVVILLVLAFRGLPAFSQLSSNVTRARDASIAIAFGGLISALVLAIHETEAVAPSISEFYLKNSVPLAHGRNVVNVILTDFRAMDTMGELVVLAVGALGVLAVLKNRPSEKGPS